MLVTYYLCHLYSQHSPMLMFRINANLYWFALKMCNLKCKIDSHYRRMFLSLCDDSHVRLSLSHLTLLPASQTQNRRGLHPDLQSYEIYVDRPSQREHFINLKVSGLSLLFQHIISVFPKSQGASSTRMFLK